MHINILSFEGCPNHRPTVARVKRIAADMGLVVPVREVQITTPAEAEQWPFLGSPTVLVNGVDIDPHARAQASYGLSCRVYPGGSGFPPDEMIQAALQSHPYRHNVEGNGVQAHQRQSGVGIAGRLSRAGLSLQEDAVRKAILKAFADEGHAPSVQDLAQTLRVPLASVHAACRTLGAADLIVLSGCEFYRLT